MGDNALSILIQAKIDEASKTTIQNQLEQLAKGLKSVKISLDLGDIKSQFSKMFGEIEREAQRRNIGTSRASNQNQSFTGGVDEVMRKATAHAEGLKVNMQSVKDIVKDMGNLTGLTETFRSADGNLVKMKATVEDVSGTLKQIRTVDVFAVLDEQGKIAEYQMGNMIVKTKEFGMSLEQLQKAGKGADYTKLYQSLEKYINDAEHATIVAKELNDAIYTQKGTERKSFQKLDPSVQQEYLKVLKQAQEKAKSIMDKEHEEALRMNKEYNERLVAELKKAEVNDLAHYRELQKNAKNNQAVMDAIHESALAEHKQRLKQEQDIEKAHIKALEMNKRIDAKELAQQGNVNLFKSQMNNSINSLLATNNVDTSRIEALRASMEKLDGKTKNVRQAMQEMKMELQSIAQDSTKFTTATANMGQLETEIHNITDSLKVGKITLEQYIEKLSGLMKNKSGEYSEEFIRTVGMDKAIKYIQQLENAQKTYNQRLKDEQILREKIEQQILKLNQINEKSGKIDSTQYNNLITEYNRLRDAIKNGSMTMDEAKSKFQVLGAQMKTFEQQTKSLNTSSSKLFSTFKMMIGIYSMFDVFNLCKRVIKDMVNEVKELDSALVSMNKVAMLSDDQLRGFVNTATEIGEAIGRTTSQVVNATADFIKMGESVENASILAKNALMYMNVGDLSNVEDATGTMISTMKAFGIEAQNSLTIVDKINNVANNFAIDAKGIGAGLQRASSALASANNDINETLAMMAVGNQIVQDPESLSNGLKVISMRIRGLSEDGEELDSKMEDVFATYANGVKIMNDDGSFRSTFKILNDLGKEWDTLTDKQQAFLAEKVAGKNRANIFLAIMENAQDLSKALETAQNSMGSAEAENEKFMNSIQGKVTQLQSAWQALANTTVNSEFVKSVVDATTAVVKFMDTCGGLVPVIVGLASAFLLLKFTPIVNGIATLTLTLLSSIPAFAGATGAVLALNSALTFGIGGLIVGGIMAVGAGIHYIATSSERAEKKINDLKSSISSLSEEQKTVEQLWVEYERLSKVEPNQRSEEQQQKYLDLMNQIKQLVPEVNGYYNEQGDFIITSTDALRAYCEEKERAIALNKEEIAQKSEKALGNLSLEIEQQREKNDLAQEYINLLNRQKNGDKLTEAEAIKLTQLRTYYQTAENAQRQYDEGHKAMQESLTVYREKLMDVLSVEEEFIDLKTEEKDAIREAIAEADYDLLRTVYQDAKDGTEGYIQKLKELDAVQQIINRNLEETKQKIANVYEAKDVQALHGEFQSITEEIQDLNDVLDDLNNGNGITAKSLKKIVETYPELLEHIHSEVDLRNAIENKMQSQQQTQQQVYNQMLGATDNYYQNVMLKDTEWRTKSENNIKKLFESLGIAYDNDFNNYKNAEQAKADISQQVINGLGSAWANYYQQMSKAYAGGSTFMDFLKTQQDYDTMSIAKVEGLEKVWNAQKEIYDTFANFSYTPITIDVGGSSKSASSGSKKGSSSSSKTKPSYIKSIYQDVADEILRGGEVIEEAIERVQAKLDRAETQGDMVGVAKFKEELVKLQEQLRNKQTTMRKELDVQIKKMAGDLSKTGMFKGYDLSNLTEKDLAEVVQKLEQRIDKAKVAKNESEEYRLSNIKSLIEDVGGAYIKVREEARALNLKYVEEDTELYNKKLEVINSVYDSEYKKIEESNRLLELQAILMNETSEEYAKNQQGMLDNLVATQALAIQAMEKIKKAGMTEDNEDYQKYLKIWYDTEKQIRTLRKKMADDARKQRQDELSKLQTDLKEAQDSVKKVLESTMKMIEQEYKNRKKMLEDELDAYEKIIDKKKEKLKADKKEADNTKAINEKTKKVTDLEAKISAIQFDTSAKGKAEKLKLEEELAKARQELQEEQADQAYDAQVDALDKEFDAFKETQDKKIKEIEDYLDKEGNIRAEAIKRIENQTQETYKKLLEWNREYGSGVDEDITLAWNGATEAMEQFNDGQLDVLSVLNKVAVKMKEVADEAEKLKDSTQTDYSDIMAGTQDSPNSSTNKPTGDEYNAIFGDTVAQMNKNSKAWGSASKEEQQRLANENKQLAKKIGAWQANSNGNGWVKGDWVVSQGGKVVPIKTLTYHTGGIVGGIDEANLKSTEQFAKLLKGEVVVTENQMAQFMNKTLPSISNISPASTGEVKIEKMFDIVVEGNLDERAVPKIEELAKQLVPRIANQLNQAVFGRGIKKPI